MSLTALAFAAIFGFGLMLAIAKRPIYGLYTYIFEFYAHPPSRWWGGDLPDLRWSLIAATVTLFAIFLHKETFQNRAPWYSSTIGRSLLLYVVWMWIQWPWVVSGTHLDGAILFSKYLILFFLIYKLIESEEDFLGLSLAHVLGCAYLGWLILVAPDTGRLESVGGPGIANANTLAMHLGTGLIFASFLLLACKGWHRWLVLSTIPLILNGIIQTETRGALVGLGVAGLVTAWLKPSRYRAVFYLLSVVAIVGFIGIANEAYVARMKTLTAVSSEQELDNSSKIRIELVKAQAKMFADYPLGAGHQGTASLSRNYLAKEHLAGNSGDRASHNTVMSVLVDQGIPGILLLVIIAGSTLSILRMLKRMDKSGLSDRIGLLRTMVGGSLALIFSAGMFAQYIKAEVLFWNLAMLVVLFVLAKKIQPRSDG